MNGQQYMQLALRLKDKVEMRIRTQEEPDAVEGVVEHFQKLFDDCETEEDRIKLCQEYIMTYRVEAAQL